MVSYKNLAWVGLNAGMSSDSARMRKRHNLKMMTYLDNHERGIQQVMREAMDVASDGTDVVYVSVDIDMVDASESPGTGAPEFRGISADEFLVAMDMLSRYKDLAAVDLCEVAPNWDHSGRTVKVATRGLISLLRPKLFDEVELPRVAFWLIEREQPRESIQNALVSVGRTGNPDEPELHTPCLSQPI